MAGMFDSYEIVETEQYSRELDLISLDTALDFRRLDDVLDGIMWGLGRSPGQFFNVTGSLWVAKTDPFPGAPRIRVWFKWDGTEEVILLSIELITDS